MSEMFLRAFDLEALCDEEFEFWSAERDEAKNLNGRASLEYEYDFGEIMNAWGGSR